MSDINATKNYNIGKMRQLIDLNAKMTNFTVAFQVNSLKGEPFDLVVIDQNTLDTNPKPEYKRVENGMISGTVENNNNVYQDHFLLVKADNPCTCQVTIKRKEIPPVAQHPQVSPNPNQSQAQPSMSNMSNMPNMPNNPMMNMNHPPFRSTKDSDGFSWVKIGLVVAVIAIAGLILYWLSRKKDDAKTVVMAGRTQPVNPTVPREHREHREPRERPTVPRGRPPLPNFRFFSPHNSSPEASGPSPSQTDSPIPKVNNSILERLKKIAIN